MAIDAVSTIAFTSRKSSSKQKTREKQKQQEVATGVGTAAAGVSVASKTASKKAVASGKTLENALDAVTATTKQINKGAKEAKGLWAGFKFDIIKYSKDIFARLQKYESVKVIGNIVNSPFGKAFAKVSGAALAFFVLITGLSKTVSTGVGAIDDIKNKYNQLNA